MTKPELIYFDAPGRAEPIRMLLHFAGIDYEDTRFPGSEWPAVKETTPLGFVPVMKIDGKQYCQSQSLIRYAAKLANWYPASEFQALKCDMVGETINELVGMAPKVSFGKIFDPHFRMSYCVLIFPHPPFAFLPP